MKTILRETITHDFKTMYEKYKNGLLVLVEYEEESSAMSFNFDHVFLGIQTPNIHAIKVLRDDGVYEMHVIQGAKYLKQVFDVADGITPISSKSNPEVDGVIYTEGFFLRKLPFNITLYYKDYLNSDDKRKDSDMDILISTIAPHAVEHFQSVNL